MSNVDARIMDRIAKLLALANSDNENEARTAAEKANELLIRYNLDAQQVRAATGSDSLDGYSHDVAFDGARRLPQQRYILPLIQNYFFVGIVRDRRVKNGPLKFVFFGTSTNVAVAREIHDFLVLKFVELWQRYQRETRCSAKSRQSYWIGLANGLGQQFRNRRAAVEQERGLIIVEDANVARYMKKIYGELQAGKKFKKRSAQDEAAYETGLRDGEKLRLQKNLGDKPAGNTRLALGAKS